MDIDKSLEMAVQLLAAYLTRTDVVVDDVRGLLQRFHDDVREVHASSRTRRPAIAPRLDFRPEKPEEIMALADPGVSIEQRIRATVLPDRILCLECGEGVTLLKSHLFSSHGGLTWDEYRQRYGLPADDALATAQRHREQQREQVLERWKEEEAKGETETV